MGREEDSSTEGSNQVTGNEKCEQDLDSWREVGTFSLWEMQSRGRQDLEHQAGETGRRQIFLRRGHSGAYAGVQCGGVWQNVLVTLEIQQWKHQTVGKKKITEPGNKHGTDPEAHVSLSLSFFPFSSHHQTLSKALVFQNKAGNKLAN